MKRKIKNIDNSENMGLGDFDGAHWFVYDMTKKVTFYTHMARKYRH